MKERKKLKEFYSQHEMAILVILITAFFIGGYLVSWYFIQKPLNDSQFELCEQVARDVYAQKGNVLIEASEDVSISITETTITVEFANKLHRGQVIARLQNGELIVTRTTVTEDAVTMSILFGILFALAIICIVLFAHAKNK